MSNQVINAIFDGDVCSYLELVPYSTNPRKLMTVGDMVRLYQLGLIVEFSQKVVEGA